MKRILAPISLLCIVPLIAGAQAAQQELQQKLAAVKASSARNQAALKQYSWTAQTQISLKGEVKKTKNESCKYGPDGQVQKTELGAPAPPQQQQMGRLKKRVVEKKKDEMQDYMERAAALIRNYVPPSGEKMQAAFQAGNASLGEAGPGAIQLQFKNYVKQGDALTLSFDSAAKALRGMNVNSYLDDPSDAVTLQVEFQSLPDGTNYAATTILNAKAKQIQVKTQNSNYQKLGS